jgi:hypothetical protein
MYSLLNKICVTSILLVHMFERLVNIIIRFGPYQPFLCKCALLTYHTTIFVKCRCYIYMDQTLITVIEGIGYLSRACDASGATL